MTGHPATSFKIAWLIIILGFSSFQDICLFDLKKFCPIPARKKSREKGSNHGTDFASLDPGRLETFPKEEVQ
jgi:hypothetical protein